MKSLSLVRSLSTTYVFCYGSLLLLLLAAHSHCPAIHSQALAATTYRRNCRLTNAGGCVKTGNSWLEFCPSTGSERIADDKSDADCVSIKPTLFAELSSASGTRYVVKDSSSMSWTPVGGYKKHTFTTDCSDVTLPCAVAPASIEAVKFTVTTNISSVTQIFIDLYVFSNSGTLSYGGFTHNVAAGSFKFDLRSDNYQYVNEGADGIAMDVEMRTLGGPLGGHTVSSGTSKYTVDGLVVSPSSYTYFDASSNASSSGPQWGKSVTSEVQRPQAANPVISFELQQLPANNGGFRFDPFVYVPPAGQENCVMMDVSASMPAVVAVTLVTLMVVVLSACTTGF